MSEGIFQDYAGRKVGGCLIRERIGSGGMGVVFEARHLALNKRVAVKLLNPALAADSTFVKRFVSEARLAAQIEHPNVVQVLNVGRDADVYFMVMQFIEGESLRARMSRGALAAREAARFILQAARGLAAAHKRGIVHRDVKPENILIGGDGVARVVDLGLSKDLSGPDSAVLTAPGMAMGTPNYISPEQATEARLADARSDIYSLGAAFYHLLVGAPPFEGPSAISIINKHISEPLPPPSSRKAEVPAALDALIGRMMAKDPADRIQSMEEVAAGLEAFLEGGGSPPVTLVEPAPGAGGLTEATLRAAPPAPSGRKWPFVVLGAAGTVMVVLMLSIVLAAGNPGRKELAAAQAYDSTHPLDFAGCLERYEEIVGKYPGTRWHAKATQAIEGVRKRREEEASKVLEQLRAQIRPLVKSNNWKAAEKLAGTFPAEFKETEAGRRAGEMVTALHVGGRAREMFDNLVKGNVAEATKFANPKHPKLIQGALQLLYNLFKRAEVTFKIGKIDLERAGAALVPMRFHIRFPPPRRAEHDHDAVHVWQLIEGEWYWMGEQKHRDGARPPRPRGDRRPPPGDTF